jgi:HEAT repeat protein
MRNEASLTEVLQALRGQAPADPCAMDDLLSAWIDALPSAVEFVAGRLHNADTAVRGRAIEVLGGLARHMRDILPRTRSVLKQAALWDEDETLRSRAVAILLQAGEWPRPSIAELIQSLNDSNAATRFSAAQALGERGQESQPAVGILLQKALRDPDGGVRLEAAMALYKIDRQEEKILPLLIKALQDPDEVRRWIAADCLGEIGPGARSAIPALRDLLQREFKSPLVRAAVGLALARIESGTA